MIKTLIVFTFLSSIAHAHYLERVCDEEAKKAVAQKQSIGQFKIGRAFCVMKTYWLEIVDKETSAYTLMTKDQKDAVLVDQINNTTTALCKQNNPAWKFTDQIAVYITNGKDKAFAKWLVKKDLCEVKEEESITF